MPRIYETANRVRIHVGNYWKLYDEHPELFEEFRVHDVGRKGMSQRISAKIKDIGWVTYGWSFSKDQVRYDHDKKILYVFDKNALDIINKLKAQGEIKRVKLIKMIDKKGKKMKLPKEVAVV